MKKYKKKFKEFLGAKNIYRDFKGYKRFRKYTFFLTR